MVISIVIEVLRTTPQSLEKRLKELEIGGSIEIIQTSAILKSGKILRKVLVIWVDLKLQWKTTSPGDLSWLETGDLSWLETGDLSWLEVLVIWVDLKLQWKTTSHLTTEVFEINLSLTHLPLRLQMRAGFNLRLHSSDYLFRSIWL